MASSTPLLAPEYSAFLYAPVGEEGSEMPVSVFSTLARQNIDPWQEAIELAALPIDVATRRLTSSLAGVTDPAGSLEIGTTVGRLISLLPARASATARPRERPTFSPQHLRIPVIMWMTTMGLVLGLQALAASRQQSPPSVKAPLPIASPAIPHELRPRSGR